MAEFDTFCYSVDHKWFSLRKRSRRVVFESGETLYIGPWRWRMSSVMADMLDDSFNCIVGVFYDTDDF